MAQDLGRVDDSSGANTRKRTYKEEKGQGPAFEAKHEKEPTPRTTASRIRDKLTDPSFLLKSVPGTIINGAARILQQEIHAGIEAAKKAEEQFIDVDKLRSDENPEAVMNKLRMDFLVIANMAADVLTAAAQRAGTLAQVVNIKGTGSEKEERGVSEQLPKLRVPHSIKAGESAEVPMTLENNSNKPTEKFIFNSTDLVNASGDRIPAEEIKFSPASLTIPPQEKRMVNVKIHIPPKTGPSVYSGLVQAGNINLIQAVLIVEVN